MIHESEKKYIVVHQDGERALIDRETGAKIDREIEESDVVVKE